MTPRQEAPTEKQLTAVCTPNSHPHEDGHVEHGYQINVLVLDDQLTVLATIDLPDWETFRPASAGHRLIEAGYMIRPGVDRADLNGWTPAAHGFTVPVVPLDEEAPCGETTEVDTTGIVGTVLHIEKITNDWGGTTWTWTCPVCTGVISAHTSDKAKALEWIAKYAPHSSCHARPIGNTRPTEPNPPLEQEST